MLCTVVIDLHAPHRPFLGVLVAGAIVLSDTVLYLYVATGRPLRSEIKIGLLAAVRAILVGTGYEHWFFGFVGAYVLQGMI